MADGILMPDDLARHGRLVRGQRVRSPISSGGLPDALSAAILCARSRASLAAWARRPGWRNAARRRIGNARAGGPSGDGWRNRRPPECRAVQVIGELARIGAVDAGIDQDQPTFPADRDGIAPDPLALPDPDTVGHLIQHRFTLSSVSIRRSCTSFGSGSGTDVRPAERRHMPHSARSWRAGAHAATAVLRWRARPCDRWRNIVAMQATSSHPVAVAVFSGRRQRPRRP